MGRSVDIRIYDKDKLIENLAKYGATEPMLSKILTTFGHLSATEYILLNCEYFEDGNPYYNIGTVFKAAFGNKGFEKEAEKIDDWFDVFLDWGSKYSRAGVNYMEIYEACEKLELETPEDE